MDRRDSLFLGVWIGGAISQVRALSRPSNNWMYGEWSCGHEKHRRIVKQMVMGIIIRTFTSYSMDCPG